MMHMTRVPLLFHDSAACVYLLPVTPPVHVSDDHIPKLLVGQPKDNHGTLQTVLLYAFRLGMLLHH